jgi:hypothetical protein
VQMDPTQIRHLRAAEPPLASYLRLFRRDFTFLAQTSMAAVGSLESHRRRLDQWRGTFAAIGEEDESESVSRSTAPEGGRIHRRLGA